ncbi:glycerophosphoryl diester phosphodiesterase membrane domain-containing protein [Actinomyces oricola]|uniref:glycerophosphoryl diester phosphodiesterase membrane domain-containing protein n=1 Tax=Actinomyces oricola TaxID=206043 RepID=UPI000FFE3742|nr:glycerophosphoryl diester phosphodiesterase membrane domain-containing protein [Actinomyces oricola]
MSSDNTSWLPPSGSSSAPGYSPPGAPPGGVPGEQNPYSAPGPGGPAGPYPYLAAGPGAPDQYPYPAGGPAGPYPYPTAGGPGPGAPGQNPYPAPGPAGPYSYPTAGGPAGPAPAGQNPYAPGAIPPGLLLTPKPGIVPLRPLSVFEILGGAFEALRVNPRAMFLPSLVVMSVIGLLSAVLTYLSVAPLASLSAGTVDSSYSEMDAVFAVLAASGSDLLRTLLVALASTILTGLLIVAVSRAVLGRLPTPGEAWERTKDRVLALIGQTLLLSLINGAIIAIVSAASMAMGYVIISTAVSDSGEDVSPGLFILFLMLLLFLVIATGVAIAFIAVRLSVAPAALVLENIGVIEGIKRSWALTRGNFWKVLGTLFLAGLITSIISGAISGATGVVGSGFAVIAPEMYAFFMALITFITAVLSALVLPFNASVTALIYVDLRMRNEGLDVELRQAAGV